MHKASLRRVGGSVMLTVPPAMLNALGLEPGANVGMHLEGDRLVVERLRPRYTLEQLLEEHEAEGTSADHEWMSAPTVGREGI